MKYRPISILAIGVLALTIVGCSGAASNTDACRDLLNIQGELDSLVNETPSSGEEIRGVLPEFADLAEAAKSVAADGHVKTAANSLGNAANDWHHALEAAAENDVSDASISPSLAATYVDAGLEVRNACSQFLP